MHSRNITFRRSFLLSAALAAGSSVALSQESAPGPLAPPPEHNVRRVVGVAPPEAPPSLPPEEIIKAFVRKEDLYVAARPQYAYRKTIRIQEFAPDGKTAGEYLATYDAVRSSDGKLYEKGLAAPESTLQYLQVEPEEVQQLTRIPAYPVTTALLTKYNVQYLSTETVDEVETYIFQLTPKTLDRQHPLFDGIVWVDQKYLEAVKTYGKWVTDLGEVHPPSLPFGTFEIYRENVDGKYWLPNYARAEGTVKLKDREVPVRVTIKWTNFKPFATPVNSAPVNPPPSNPPPSPGTSPAAKP
ncbi:MAG TPA: hypothetical protein VF758_06735 [Candidatus Acidoferrum sp.]